MRHRYVVLGAVLVCVALTKPTPITFLHPKARIILTGMQPVDIPVQLWIARHQDNRSYAITWDGENCAGSSARSLDGDQDSQIHPPQWNQLKVRLSGPGVCAIWASVYGPGRKIRASAGIQVEAK